MEWELVTTGKVQAPSRYRNRVEKGVPIKFRLGEGKELSWKLIEPRRKEEESHTRIESVSRRIEILREATYECAFCKGTGERPPGTRCPVCRGKGQVEVQPPVVRCAFCNGRGEESKRSNITCLVCKGKGVVSIEEPIETCPSCRGKGKPRGGSLYCVTCKGKGVVTIK